MRVPSGSADVSIFAAGTTYRLTVDGAQSDVLTSSGALALSGLTLGAATANEPAETTYVIVHAGGGSGARAAGVNPLCGDARHAISVYK